MKLIQTPHIGSQFTRMKFFLLLMMGCIGSVLVLSCSSSATANAEMEAIVHSKDFKIENQWAIPLGAGMINLIGNPNVIEFKKDSDSVEVFLPYFGVRQMGGGYGDSGGIKFKGIPKDLEEKSLADNARQIEFTGNDGNEVYQFIIKIYSSKNVSTSVNSSQRQTISYRGNISAIKEEKE